MSATYRIVITLAATIFHVSAQQPSFNRLVHVVVTEPANRLVTGLEQQNFEIVENGSQRTITYFDTNSPVAIAIVGLAPPDIAGLRLPESELIQAQSVSEAIRELAASKNVRKVLIVPGALDTVAVPEGIRVLNAEEGTLARTMIEIHNEYVLGFSSSDASSVVDVTLRPPSGLPPLKLAKK